jgi:hypothetical protein
MTLARTRPRLALAMTVGLLATACDAPAPTAAATKAAPALLEGVIGDGFKWSSGTLTLEVIDGEVIFNGKKSGALKPGDRVTVTSDGTLFINHFEPKAPDGHE